MTRFNIRKRLAKRALDQLGETLDQLDPPPEVENWILYKITSFTANRIIFRIMSRWPWHGPDIWRHPDQGEIIETPEGIKTWRSHLFIWWKGPEQSWADGSYAILFGRSGEKTYGVNFGKVLQENTNTGHRKPGVSAILSGPYDPETTWFR